MNISLVINDGKYRYIVDDDGARASREGEEWWSIGEDNLAHHMAQHIVKLERALYCARHELLAAEADSDGARRVLKESYSLTHNERQRRAGVNDRRRREVTSNKRGA